MTYPAPLKNHKMLLKNLSRRLVAISLLSFLLSACGGGGGSTSGSGTNSQGGIVVLGDSISNGYTTTVAYPDILRSRTGLSVENKSITGGRAETVISPLRTILAKFKPQYVLILLGTNNAQEGDVQTAVTAIAFAVKISIEAGAIPIVGTVPHIFTNSLYDRRAGDISSQISGIPGARIANIRNVINRESLTTDGVHPNVEGQNAIANEFLRFLN